MFPFPPKNPLHPKYIISLIASNMVKSVPICGLIFAVLVATAVAQDYTLDICAASFNCTELPPPRQYYSDVPQCVTLDRHDYPCDTVRSNCQVPECGAAISQLDACPSGLECFDYRCVMVEVLGEDEPCQTIPYAPSRHSPFLLPRPARQLLLRSATVTFFIEALVVAPRACSAYPTVLPTATTERALTSM